MYKHRRVLVVFSAIVATLLVYAGFLLRSYILSSGGLKEVQSTLEQARFASEQLQETKSASSVFLKNAQKKLTLLGGGETQPASAVIRLITDNKGDYVRIQSVAFEKGVATEGKIVLAGIARDRDSLTDFVKMIESQEIFTKVDLPVSNFAKDKDINFSINIFGTF